jgi:hypothetical protein
VIVGRRPASNPKGVHLGIRVDTTTAEALDREIEREVGAKPGLTLNRSAIVRMLIAEALLARAGRKPRT